MEAPKANQPVPSGLDMGSVGPSNSSISTPSPAVAGPRVVLIGPMGAGKTAVGRTLAGLWQVPFFDTDQAIGQSSGQSVAEFFATLGEVAFRATERDTIEHGLSTQTGVMALGGGALTTPAVFTLIEKYSSLGGQVVYLEVSPDQALARIEDTALRPMLGRCPANAAQRWRDLMAARQPAYEAVATLSIDTNHLSPKQVALQIDQSIG